MFKKDMTSAVDNLFSDMMKMPTIFGSNMIDRIFSTEPKELEEVQWCLQIFTVFARTT